MRRKYLLVVLTCLMALMVPSHAYAADGSLVESFGNGISTWTQPEKTEPVAETTDEVRLTATGDESPTMVSTISGVISGATTSIDGTAINPLVGTEGYKRVLLLIVPTAVLLVFFWWGVRKALRTLLAAFRKGRMSV